MIVDEKRGELSIGFDELLELEKNGHVSEEMVSFVEKEIGRKLRKTGPLDFLKIVKTDAGDLPNEETIEEMYARSVKETDAIISGNEVYGKLYYGNNIQEGKDRWCKPELFYYLELDKERALAEIRAAAYPAVVSFFEAKRGKTSERVDWRTPYLSFQDRVDPKGMSLPSNGNVTMCFYLNNNKEVKFTLSKVLEAYSKGDFEQEWHSFAFQRRKNLAGGNKTPLLEDTFLNIKTGKSAYAISKQLMGEGTMANALNRIKNTAWFQTWSGPNCNLENLSSDEKQKIVDDGRACIKSLHECLLSTDNLHLTSDGMYSKVFEHEL